MNLSDKFKTNTSMTYQDEQVIRQEIKALQRIISDHHVSIMRTTCRTCHESLDREELDWDNRFCQRCKDEQVIS